MVLLIDNNNYIYGRNPVMKKEDMPSGAVWYDGDFSFQDGKNKEGFYKVYKWDGENPIVIYEPIPELPTPEPTQLDIIEKEMKKKNADIANAAIEAYEKELNFAYEEGVNSL